MFRRPAPGRPARQCGHPKSAHCDCLAKRTLCCTLTNEQWDAVARGDTVAVHMYDNREDLESAYRKDSLYSQSPQSGISDGSSGTPRSSLGSFTPSPMSRMQMFGGMGGPQGNINHVTDPFAWTGQTPQAPLHMQNPGPQPMSRAPSLSNVNTMPPPPFINPGHAHPGSVSGNLQYDMYRNSTSQQSNPSAPQTPWPQPRQEYMNFNPGALPNGQDLTIEGLKMDLKLDQMHLNQDFPAMLSPHSIEAASSMDPHLMPPPQFSNQYFTPQPSAVSDFGMDTTMPLQSQIERVPAQQPTQSCCSSKRQQPPPQPMQNFRNPFYIPNNTPISQFPCPRCASTMCTCSNCPEVMQSADLDGAWASGCGRSGHLDAAPFTMPGLPAQPQQSQQTQQPQQVATPAASNRGSCCGSKTTTARSSPFLAPQLPPQNPPQWSMTPLVPGMNSPPLFDGQASTIDPSMLYRPGDWQG